jgi:L-lysine exporter family protein LysE/ArgO
VAVCIVSDALLIGLGVLGLAQLGGLSEVVKTLLVSGGIVFLLVYGAQAFGRCRKGGSTPSAQPEELGTVRLTRPQATLAALAFAWLNPHAWLDTAVLIGTASLAWGAPGNTLFGIGAATGSLIWFAGLGLCVFYLGQRLRTPILWRVLDGLVALMMWGTALVLGRDLLGL